MNQDVTAGESSLQSNNAMENFERLLPLEGGNNFRDLGGYRTKENKMVRPGLIFRSGVMTSLTEADQQRLNSIPINTIVDFRSREELEIFPNHWAVSSKCQLIRHDYSMMEISSIMHDAEGNKLPVYTLYKGFPSMLRPQLTLLFKQLLEGNGPLVFNCSAGQDRTGFAAALILNTLGVAWETILEDYHLSTQYRRPEIEHAGVDFNELAETNAFAEMMLRYTKDGKKAVPLFTNDKVPFLQFAFKNIEANYGSVSAYLAQEIGLDSSGVEQLKADYLQ